MARPSEEARVAGIRLTSPDRVLWEGQGITKRGLAEFYAAIAGWILPHLAGRPLTLVRCPAGQEKECFVQRRASDAFPSAVRRVEVVGEEGAATHLMVDSLEGLLSLVQIGVLELHTWSARSDRLDRADRMIFDLDPDPGLPWARIVEAAVEVRDLLAELGLRSFVKTTGGKGLHVVAPLVRRHGWEEVREFSRAVAEELARRAPERYLAQAAKAERGGRIYVDYLRNAWGASTVAAYSTRARPGAPVSTPLSWEELGPEIRSDSFTVETIPQRLTALSADPWSGYAELRQGITKAMRAALAQA